MQASDYVHSEFTDTQRKQAMTLFLDAWDEACSQGLSGNLLSEVCLYLALTDLVEDMGEEDVAALIASIPGRIRLGEFSIPEEFH
jgi:hypothetical protein